MSQSMMIQPGLADVVERFDDSIRQRLSSQGHQVLNHIQACRTSLLRGRLLHCNECQKHYVQYHSCRDRHCPVCGYQASQDWVDARMQDVLRVTYHHLVFTLPHELNPWVTRYRSVIYRLLFRAVWATLKTFAENPKRLDGQLGAMMMLHTWGQTLTRHVHVHCLVPGGALQADGQWRSAPATYLFPVRALSRYYRGKMVALLRKARQELKDFDDEQVDEVLNNLMSKDWVVYSKPVISRTNTVVEYLARYTKRIGLTNARLLKMDESHVWLRYRNNRDEGRHQVMQLRGEEPLRRFLLHLLPRGFMRVRYYGYLANAHRRKKLRIIRSAIDNAASAPMQQQRPMTKERPLPARYQARCITCQEIMVLIREIPAAPRTYCHRKVIARGMN